MEYIRTIMKRLLLCLALLWCSLCPAQNTILRGKASPAYPFLYNGTYFWADAEYSRGEILFDGHVYKDILLNIDACRQVVDVCKEPGGQPISPYSELVGYVVKDGQFYVNLRYAGIPNAPDGFFIELTDGSRVVYYQVRKPIYSEPGDHNGKGGIGYDDPKYRYDCPTYFYKVENWYEYTGGQLVKLKKRKARRMKLIPAAGVPGLPDSYLVSKDILPSERDIRDAATFSSQPLGSSLPAGYFSDGSISAERAALLDAIEQENMIAMYRNKTYEIGSSNSTGKGSVIVSGVVTDVATGEALPGVSVSDANGTYALTDAAGHYSIKLPRGENLLSFSEYTKEDMAVHVIIYGEGGLDVVMKEKVTMLNSALVAGESMAEHRRTTIGLEKINIKTIGRIPSAFGEGDVLKAVLTLPGVKTVGEASSGFNVRGGSSDQNLILFNEGTVYNPSHMFGIFSAFNPDVVESLDIYKSSIPVQYGGRISSVLDIHSKEGSTDRIRGSLGLGLLTSHGEIEGPIGEKTSFVLGGRTTYSNWMLNRLPADSGYSGGRAGFNDVNLGITHHPDEDNTIQAFAYWSRDKFSFSGDTTFRYSNLNVALKWKHRFTKDRNLTVSCGYDRYGNTLTDSFLPVASYELSTSVGQAFLKAGMTDKYGNHTLSYGASAIMYSLNPGTRNPFGAESIVAALALDREQAVETALYAGDLWKISEQLSLDGGVRISGFAAFSPMKSYLGPEFRISAKYSPERFLSFKAGFNSMTQYIHLISNSSSISPMDTWKICDMDIKPQRGWQAAAGAYLSAAGGQVDISLEGYYKHVRNFLDYKSGAVLSMNPNLADDLVTTYNRAYGVEFMVKKPVGKLSGWLAYTYSRSLLREMEDRGVLTINGGDWYAAPHDKPHDVKLVANYEFTHRYSVSVNLDYSTGRPVTLPVGQYMYNGGWRLAYSERNGYRIPDYFRLDLAMNIEPGHYLKAFTHMSATFGCYNVTGRKNVYSVFYTTDGGAKVKGYMISVFATQIPYVSLNLKF